MSALTFRDASGIWHYLRVQEVPNGTDRLTFKCHKQSDDRMWREPHATFFREDAYATCLWCVTGHVR